MLEVYPANRRTPAEWAEYIGEAWSRVAAGFVDTGRRLLAARSDLDEAAYMATLAELAMSPRVAAELIQIAEDDRIAGRPAFAIPRARDTLLELSRLTDEEWGTVEAAGLIKAELERKDLRAFLRATTNRQIAARTPSLPAGRYATIVVDPPWAVGWYDRDIRPNQAGLEYPTMTEEQLADFPLPAMAADDCHLFVWATPRFLPVAIDLLDDWGFTYSCTFVWHKNGGFQVPGQPQYNCEFAVYARQGSPEFVDTKAFPTCFNADRRGHSRKPNEFYDMVRRTCAGPRIDVFSRERRDGFDQHGNEVDKFADADDAA